MNFETEFVSDTELEIALDEFVESFKDSISEDEDKTTILDFMRVKQMQFAYAALKYILNGTDAVISYKLNEPFKTMGSISAEGMLLEFDKPEWFARIAEFASNTEVYPITKGKVRLTFTFHGLTKEIV